jgi:hypothetical protein
VGVTPGAPEAAIVSIAAPVPFSNLRRVKELISIVGTLWKSRRDWNPHEKDSVEMDEELSERKRSAADDEESTAQNCLR